MNKNEKLSMVSKCLKGLCDIEGLKAAANCKGNRINAGKYKLSILDNDFSLSSNTGLDCELAIFDSDDDWVHNAHENFKDFKRYKELKNRAFDDMVYCNVPYDLLRDFKEYLLKNNCF